MDQVLRILILEDQPTDAELVVEELRIAGLSFTAQRVEEEPAFRRACEEFRPDAILCDYRLPKFDGMTALKIARQYLPEVPVIFVTGALGDIQAVELLQAGASDYVLKDRLARLAPAIRKALATAQNVRAQKTAEKSLRESEERLRAMSEAMHDALILLDGEGHISFWNPAAERMFGYTAGEARGMELYTLIVPDRFQEEQRERFRHFRETGESWAMGKTVELCARHRNNTEFFIELSLSAMAIDDAWHAIGIVQDITDKKDNEAKLLNAQRMEAMGKMAAGVAHDFNNALAAIGGFADLLLQDLRPNSPQHGFASRISERCERGKSIVQQILTFARSSEVPRSPLELNALINRCRDCRSDPLFQAVDLSFRLSREPQPILGNETQINQLLCNLCQNARDARRGDKVSVRISTQTAPAEEMMRLEGRRVEPNEALVGTVLHDRKYCRLQVEDDGTGMSPELLSRIFEPFFTTKDRMRGTGLGLAVVHGVVHNHQAVCHVESSVGRGTTFSIYIPLEPTTNGDQQRA